MITLDKGTGNMRRLIDAIVAMDKTWFAIIGMIIGFIAVEFWKWVGFTFKMPIH